MIAVIIVFNTDRYLLEQIRLLQKHVTSDIAVIDNSNDFSISDKLKKICDENKVDYTKTAVNESDFSKSHAFACEIAIGMYRNKADEILLLDHDIFPIKPFQKPKEGTILSGIPQYRKTPKDAHEQHLFTYLWAGLLYINTKALEGIEIDIKPCVVADVFLDTGGGLYKLILGNPDRIVYFQEQHQETEYGIYSLIDNAWMHLIGGSNWAGIPKEKHEERINHLMSILYANS